MITKSKQHNCKMKWEKPNPTKLSYDNANKNTQKKKTLPKYCDNDGDWRYFVIDDFCFYGNIFFAKKQ